MRWSRSFFATIAVAWVLTTCAFAGHTGGPSGTEACSGTDMLPELSQTDSENYRTIMSEAGATENTAALLWKIEKPGISTSHLFGTMHLSDVRVATLPKSAEDKLDAAKTVVLEVADTSSSAMVAAMAGQASLIFYSGGQSLTDQLSPDEFKKVESVTAAAGMPDGLARVMRPWLVSTLLSTSECERRRMAAGTPVLDQAIAEKAKSKGLAVVGLETVEQQLNALSGIPEKQQIEMLKVGLSYLDRRDDMLETMVQMYLKHQMGAALPFQIALARKVGVSAAAFESFERKLLIERNEGMTRNLLPLLEKGGAFIAVGALHLPGKDGLVAKLRQAGFAVTAAE